MLFHVKRGPSPRPRAARARFVPYLPLDVPYRSVEVRAPGETTLPAGQRSGGAAGRAEAAVRRVHARSRPTSRPVARDRPLVGADAHRLGDLPVLGTVACHESALRASASRDERARSEGPPRRRPGRRRLLRSVDGSDDPDGPFSAAAFGAAIDLNPGTNDDRAIRPTNPVSSSRRWRDGASGGAGRRCLSAGRAVPLPWNRAAAPAGC